MGLGGFDAIDPEIEVARRSSRATRLSIERAAIFSPSVNHLQQIFRQRLAQNRHVTFIRSWLGFLARILGSGSWLGFEMLTSRLLGIFVVVSALVSPGAEFAVARDAPANDFSSLLEWKNQIAADIEHNRRYLPGVRTRGKIGVVYFDLNINRAGWVVPGTRIVTVDRQLGSAALLLLQQSQPFPAPDHVGLRDTRFHILVPIRFNEIPPQDAAGLDELERRKLLE